MAKTEAQKAARQRYKEKNLELVAFEVKKGMSAEYTAAAARIGLGKMEMIRRAIAEFIARHADGAGADLPAGASTKTQAESTQSAQKPQLAEEIPIIYSEGTQTAQNQPVSTQVQTIQPAAVDASQVTTGGEMRLIDAVKTLTPESQRALLKFLQTLQG